MSKNYSHLVVLKMRINLIRFSRKIEFFFPHLQLIVIRNFIILGKKSGFHDGLFYFKPINERGESYFF